MTRSLHRSRVLPSNCDCMLDSSPAHAPSQSLSYENDVYARQVRSSIQLEMLGATGATSLTRLTGRGWGCIRQSSCRGWGDSTSAPWLALVELLYPAPGLTNWCAGVRNAEWSSGHIPWHCLNPDHVPKPHRLSMPTTPAMFSLPFMPRHR